MAGAPERAFRESELPWRLIAQEASDGLFVTDAALHVLWANRRACELLERRMDEIAGHAISDFFWSATDLEQEPMQSGELRAGHTTLTHRAFRTPNGERRILEVSARGIGEGLVLGIARDVTARVDTLERLRRSEGSFRALIERCPEGIIVHVGGVTRYANSAFATMLGFDSPASVVGEEALGFLHPGDRAAAAERIRLLNANGAASPFREMRLMRRDGTEVLASISGVAITYEGQPAIAVIARDVTEQRTMLAQLANAEKMVSLGVLSAGVAHEVNNPLAYLTLRLRALATLREQLEAAVKRARAEVVARIGEEASAEVIGEGLDDETFTLFSDHVATAAEGAERVRVIVEDLRMFSRADSDTGRLLDVRQPLKRAISMVGHRLGQGAELVVEDSPVPHVLASEGRLTQVFLNLLVNAVQAISDAPPGPHEVRVKLETEGDQVVVSIRDTGAGIAAEDLPRVFEPFFTTKPVGVGTGLGLSICHGIVTVYGGTIRVESSVGHGSTFKVSLPRAMRDG